MRKKYFKVELLLNANELKRVTAAHRAEAEGKGCNEDEWQAQHKLVGEIIRRARCVGYLSDGRLPKDRRAA